MANIWIVQAVESAMACCSPQTELPICLGVPYPLDRSDVEVLLGCNGIAALMVTPEAACALTGDARIGIIADDGNWILPKTKVRCFLLLKDPGLLALRCLWTALRAGVFSVIHPDGSASWRRSSLLRWALPKVVGRSVSVMIALTPALSSWHDRVWLRHLGDLARHHVRNPAEYFSPGRITLVSGSLSSGGSERQAVNTALAIARTGRNVSVLCHRLGSVESDFYLPVVAPHMPVRRVRDPLEIWFSESTEDMEEIYSRLHGLDQANVLGVLPPWVAQDVLSLAFELLLERPSVVHLWQDYINVVGGLAAMLIGIPRIVLSMRNLAPYHFPYFLPFMASIYRLLAQQSSVVMLNNSQAGAADYAAWLGIDAARIQILRNGIDLQSPSAADVAAWRRQISLAANVRVIGGVLRLAPEKNPLLWLETAAVVARNRADVHFLLVGDGPMRSEVDRRAHDLGISDRLHLPGIVRDVRLPMAAMDLFFLSSRQEGLPNVLIEAQMLGLPVVTTLAGGSAETVDHGCTGWVVPDHDPQALAERLLQVLDNSEWRRQAGAKAQTFARIRFGLEPMLKATLHAYGVSGS